MGFGEAIKTCFQKFVTFSGRARRSEYWYFYLFTVLLGLGAGIVDGVVAATSGARAGILRGLVQLVVFLPTLAVQVRRLHDTNRSGFWILGFVVYIVVGVVAIVAALAAGAATPQPGANMIAVMVVYGLGFFAFAITLFVFTVLDGTPGPNRYGADPKGPDVTVFS